MPNKNIPEKLYRPSATVIITVKEVNNDDCNYKILLTKRSPETAITTDHYVFPGGVHDTNADDNNDWAQLYSEMGVTEKHIEQLYLNHLPNRPKFLQNNYHCRFSRDISLRIAAIREVFEEVGILLCLTKTQITNRSWFELKSREYYDNKHLQLPFNNKDQDLIDWQQRVHNNGQEFFQMCKYFQIVPDLWSLHEWSAWRSPMYAIKKYDTVFYIVGLVKKPDIIIEPSEVAGVMWAKPVDILHCFNNGLIWLAGSLFYEISRLANFNNWSKLCSFALNRSTKGCTLLIFHYYYCSDCTVAVLPGDDYFCIKNLIDKHIELPLTATEFANKTKNLHRIHYKTWNNCKIVTTISSLDGHLQPLNIGFHQNIIVKENKSKL